MTRACLLLALAAACGAPPRLAPAAAPSPAPAPAPPARDDLATVPLYLVGNRPLVDVTLRAPDGTTRVGRFLVDSGGGGFLLSDPLAAQLGLTRGASSQEEGETFAPITSPLQASIGPISLALDPQRVAVVVGRASILPPAAPGHADGLLPGHVLAKYHVVLDYPHGTFTIARPGALAPRGDAMPMPVASSSGFPRTELSVAGTTYGMLLDTGASFTMLSQARVDAWAQAHPEWERHDGAYGEAKTLGGQALETLFVPTAAWGTHTLARFGLVAQHTGVFEKWMSSMTAAPVVGSLAGNVLSRFRVDLDYPEQKLYLSGP